MDYIVQEASRFWQDLMSRPDGPFALRFLMQPTVSSLLAIRDGIRDAKAGRDPYLALIATNADERRGALKEGLNATARVLFLGLLLDFFYQMKTFGSFRYVGEAIVIAFALAFLPYLLLRGPVRRIAAAWMARKAGRETRP
ncbi:hypothetical protein L6Q21_11500 [Sandaracinobacter sp. RS1-74]|uniref:hypothetical protein n=1 Tax=Sandaracinobacteroides sayramensis TaxID=2913411 RepID=UPI001EDC4E71|nr:hypothetical protein [Sandaracinobacteroides sayramensis]MCG2841606.1 hypothetical protein [Sandaracinobacteroides sayramensis]